MPTGARGDIRYRGAGITGACELLEVGAENPLGSSRRVLCALNCCPISPALYRGLQHKTLGMITVIVNILQRES